MKRDFPTVYEEFIYKRTYSRYLYRHARREDWPETVKRYGNFFSGIIPPGQRKIFSEIIESIKKFEVMPSMRALWAAGEALERENICAYNCAYLSVDRIKAFSEILYLLMCGTGVGFSVEQRYISRLPDVPLKINKVKKNIVFEDSKIGWAEGVHKIIKGFFSGEEYSYDLSKIRAEGVSLKVFGGRASGPKPLKDLIEFIIKLFNNSKGRKLTSIECHDLICFIAQIVVVGGVRRSAMLSLSDIDDEDMAHAKDGHFWHKNPQRILATNSVVYDHKPTTTDFLNEWLTMIRSGSGERGLFNRESSDFIVKKTGRRDFGDLWGCNPCSEIILRDKQFCNLSEVIVREGDSLDKLIEKVRYATILGIIQSTLTRFNYIDKEWLENTQKETLLGVSLTGLRDHSVLNHVSVMARKWLASMKKASIDTAEEWSELLNVKMPAAITCVKPSGTVSQLVNSSSGIHPRYAPYYLRRVRISGTDPLSALLKKSGLPFYSEIENDSDYPKTIIFEFPVKSPDGAICRNDVDAIEQLEYWKMLQNDWCEHKPSCTVYVKPEEWIKVADWVYENWKFVSGISFLPFDGGSYKLAPYKECTRDVYSLKLKGFPEIDFTKLTEFETMDLTEGGRELSCAGGRCENY